MEEDDKDKEDTKIKKNSTLMCVGPDWGTGDEGLLDSFYNQNNANKKKYS